MLESETIWTQAAARLFLPSGILNELQWASGVVDECGCHAGTGAIGA